MEDYKLNALHNFLKDRKINFRFASSTQIPYRLVRIKNTPIYARLAVTPQQVQQGLMGVDKLGDNEGCLLCFADESPASLWMKNCKINLQAAMIDSAGEITDIFDMYYTDPYYVHTSSRPIKYALEMPEGFFTTNNIKVGDTVRL